MHRTERVKVRVAAPEQPQPIIQLDEKDLTVITSWMGTKKL